MASSPVDSAKPFWPNHEHWSVEIPLDTPHPRLERDAASAAWSCCVTWPSRFRPTSTWTSSTWTGRAAATRTSRRSRPPTASSTAAGSGTRATSARTRTRSSRATRTGARRSGGTSRTSARTSAGYARSSWSPRTTRPRSAASTATTTTASTRTPRVGWSARGSSSPTTPRATCSSWSRVRTVSPIRPPRSGCRSTRLAVRRRHAAALARRRAQRHRAPVRAHQLVREWARARPLGARAAAVADARHRPQRRELLAHEPHDEVVERQHRVVLHVMRRGGRPARARPRRRRSGS